MNGLMEASDMETRKTIEEQYTALYDKTAASLGPEGKAELRKLIALRDSMAVCPSDEVIKEYDFGTFRIIRCRGCFVYRSAGYRAVSMPVYNGDMSNGGGALYSAFSFLCDLRDRKESNLLGKDGQELYDTYLLALTTAMTYPLLMFQNDRFLVETVKAIHESRLRNISLPENPELKPETEEDMMKNQAFEQQMLDLDAVDDAAAE